MEKRKNTADISNVVLSEKKRAGTEKEQWRLVPEKLLKLLINNNIKKDVDERLKHGTVICS